MKLLQINTISNSGSTGRIAEDIGIVMLARGHKSYIAFGRGNRPSQSELIRIGKNRDVLMHGIKTAVFDRHGFGSVKATKALIKEIDKFEPDVVGLHNLHGYYLNIEILFDYLHRINIPVLWTLFDCWSFTGHCSYFDNIDCQKWINGCYSCPKKMKYPSSYLIDNSKKNYFDKKEIFTSFEKLQFIVHSNWLKGLVKQSFLKNYPIHHIFSGIDINRFSPDSDIDIRKKYNINEEKIILGVANIWDVRKGLSEFLSLKKYFEKDIAIVLVGLTQKQIRKLPPGIVGLERTESVEDLAAIYGAADVFVNPTWMDNFPTTNLESLACGTPVVTYRTGGSPEAIDEDTGLVVEQGNIEGLANAVTKILEKSQDHYKLLCRNRAERLFNKDDRYSDYLKLYEEMIGRSI